MPPGTPGENAAPERKTDGLNPSEDAKSAAKPMVLRRFFLSMLPVLPLIYLCLPFLILIALLFLVVPFYHL